MGNNLIIIIIIPFLIPFPIPQPAHPSNQLSLFSSDPLTFLIPIPSDPPFQILVSLKFCF